MTESAARYQAVCQNCWQPIRLTTGPGFRVWDHGARQGNHTVCQWRENMRPTARVATPAGVI